MAFGIFRVAKAKSGDLGGLEAEANRDEKNKKNFPGSSIDWEKTIFNEHLIKTNGWKRTADDLIKTKGCRVRSNSTYLIDTVITASADFFKTATPETEKSFFQDSLDFCKRHFGIVINAVIHRDETTPHIHIACIPLVERENGKFSLSAKDLLGGNQDMHKLQDCAYKEIFEKFGLERGEVKDPATRREHLDTLDYKLQMRKEEVKAAEADKIELEREIGKLEQIRSIIGSVKDIACDLFTRVFNVIREGLHQLCDKIEHNQSITPNDLAAADCKMSRCAIYTSNNGEKLPLYAPKTNSGEPLTWGGSRPIYGVEEDSYVGLLKMDSNHTFSVVESPEWENTFSRENRDFNDSVCERDIVTLEERIDLIDSIVNNDNDPIDNAYEDQEPPEEIDYENIDSSFDPFAYDDDDNDPDDCDPVCV